MKLILLSFSVLFLFSIVVSAAEPSYCDPDKFASLGINPPLAYNEIKHIKKLKMFEVGQVVLAGMAVGKSNTTEMENLAESYSTKISDNNYCTWFFDGSSNPSATKAFISHPIANPFSLTVASAPSEFMDAVQSSFFQDESSFITCAKKYKYIAMGCTQMQHRGPTVFGMLLAFSGCTAAHSAEIANSAFGLNGLSAALRLAVIQAAYDYGNESPDQRAELASLLGN
jgi:hypothetical protein